MPMWEPWRGCRRYSEGCKFCYIHKGDAKRGVDTEAVVKTAQFEKPVARDRKGEYKIKSGQTVYVCFSSDFFIDSADAWRQECWDMMRARSDLHFLFLTKRIERFSACIPADWGDGYENVTIGCTVENQQRADERLAFFATLPIKHKNIICQPMLSPMEIAQYLGGVELVIAGGESDRCARALDFDWVLALREQCVAKSVRFEFRQCGTNFIKDGKSYAIPVRELTKQARKANIHYTP